MEEIMVEMLVMNIGETYLNGGTVEDLIKEINNNVDDITDNDSYEEILGKTRAKINLTNELMGLKKLEENKADLLKLVQFISKQLETISRLAIYKEAE